MLVSLETIKKQMQDLTNSEAVEKGIDHLRRHLNNDDKSLRNEAETFMEKLFFNYLNMPLGKSQTYINIFETISTLYNKVHCRQLDEILKKQQRKNKKEVQENRLWCTAFASKHTQQIKEELKEDKEKTDAQIEEIKTEGALAIRELNQKICAIIIFIAVLRNLIIQDIV